MTDYKKLHNEAMELAEKAIMEIKKGNKEKALDLNLQAFEKEREVALASEKEPEPLRSILLRSAATLGYRCGNFEETGKLIRLAFSGNPPQDLKIELDELLIKATLKSLYFDYIHQMKVRAVAHKISSYYLLTKKEGIVWQIEGENDASISIAA